MDIRVSNKMKIQLFSATVFNITIAAFMSYVGAKCNNPEWTSPIDFEIKCERSLFGNHEYEVRVICRSNDWTKFPYVDLDLFSAAPITFESCSFPTTMNTPSILRSMDVGVANILTFYKSCSTINRKNLKGLSVSNLIFEKNDFKELPFDLLYDVLNMSVLKITATKLQRIPDAFFGVWAQNVSTVIMNENRIQKIASHDFSHIVNVKVIDLSFNVINEIEPRAFDDLHRLNTLNLAKNNLNVLPNGIFHHLGKLAILDLSLNSFRQLPQDLLSNTKNLMEFSMTRNEGTLATLPNYLFKNLIHLRDLSLAGGALESLPPHLFAGCSQLMIMSLENNQLKSLPSGLFDDTRNLINLNLASNHLESLPAYIFRRFHQLRSLDICNNNLTSLMPEHLEGLQSVYDFDASDNYLTRIADQFITYFKSATNIDLSNNQISFCTVKSMQVKVEASENEIRSLSVNGVTGTFTDTSQTQAFQQLDFDPSITLKNINLCQNNITAFNTEVVSMMRYSYSIDLRNNHISKIDVSGLSSENLMRTVTDVFGVTKTNYMEVYLENNPLHCDCKIMDFARHLYGWRKQKLYNIIVGTNFTCASPPEFENRQLTSSNWKELYCFFKADATNDACTEICTCREYPGKRLLSVDCSHRNLTQLPMIENINNWSIELNMAGNALHHSPSLSGSYLKDIAILDLSYNNITKVTIDLFSPKLHTLKLHGNSISRLDSDIITHLDRNNSLNDFTIHDNKWICDCATRPLLSFVQKEFMNYNFHDVSCYGTDGKQLYKMTVAEICKDVIAITIIASLSIIFIGTVLACLVALYYKYQCELKVWLYSKQLCLWFVTEDELDKDKEYDAFISFSHKDEDFVEKEIVAKLEEGPRPYKLCLHYRDWLAGEWIPLQISRSVEESRRTIVILTPNFLESVWGLMEFRVAHTQALKEGRARLIVIIYGDIGNINNLDQEMQDYLRLNTYIKWGDPWFWDKLKYALPHAKDFAKARSRNVEKNLVLFPITHSFNIKIDLPPSIS